MLDWHCHPFSQHSLLQRGRLHCQALLPSPVLPGVQSGILCRNCRCLHPLVVSVARSLRRAADVLIQGNYPLPPGTKQPSAYYMPLRMPAFTVAACSH